jgi:GMP synthase-like glutamine amidotransferase
MRTALIANSNEADPGFVGRSLRRRGYALTDFLREQHSEWPSLDGFDLVVAMGSGWSTYWDHVAEPVLAEQALMGEAMSRGIPILGICFGGQQLANALGGTVTKAQSTEIGWFSVEKLSETADLAPESLFQGPWMQWHYDSFTVPSGATPLAQSPAGPQAIVCGRALGLQFHPEATETIVKMWSSDDGVEELVSQGIDAEDLLSMTRLQVADSEDRCEALVDWFLSTIAQGHMPQG